MPAMSSLGPNPGPANDDIAVSSTVRLGPVEQRLRRTQSHDLAISRREMTFAGSRLRLGPPDRPGRPFQASANYRA